MARKQKPVKYTIVDAFTDSEFKGNPAAVCLLEEKRDEKWLQSLAAEFNISETCFLTRITDHDSPNDRFHLRWFTPLTEVDLCGHATLAAAHVCFTSGIVNGTTVEFLTLSGILTARKVHEAETGELAQCENEARQPFLIELDFPAVPFIDYNSNEMASISKALSGSRVIDIKKTTAEDLLVVLPSAKAVAELQPQFEEIRKCPGRAVMITGPAAPGSGFDYFSRFFGPKLGVNEDPVTGSAHCSLVLYWSKELGKCDFVAYQASPRGGILKVHLDQQTNRVKLQGKAVTVMEAVTDSLGGSGMHKFETMLNIWHAGKLFYALSTWGLALAGLYQSRAALKLAARGVHATTKLALKAI